MLGLNTLKDIDGCISIVEQRTGEKLDMYNIPEDDKKVYNAFCDGLTASIFQFNGEIPTGVCKKIKPECMMDLSAITAACRPGTLYATLECIGNDGKVETKTFIKSWVDRRTGKEPITYLHPSLEPILSDTQGIFIYQEQINKMLISCCGYSADKADEIREIIGKKKADKMASIVPDIKRRLVENGWDEPSSDAIINLCIAASSYVFNLSHSANYAYIGYVCMYLKCHYPLEWWTAILRNSTHKDLECNAVHFKEYLMLPDVNKSDVDFYIIDSESNKIVYPLSMIKGVKNAANDIVAKKPYTSMADFYAKVDKKTSNKRVVSAMIYAGAFDGMPEAGNSKYVWDKRNNLLKAYAALRREKEPPDLMKSSILVKEVASLCVGDVDVYSLWGIYKTALVESGTKIPHWLSRVSDIRDLPVDKNGASVITVGIIKSIRDLKTKKGEKMCFVTIASGEHSISVTIFPDMYKAIESGGENKKITEGDFMALKGKINIYNERASIIANEVDLIDASLI